MAGDRVSGGVRITPEMVVARVRALFAPADQDAVLAVLDECTRGEPSPRVQMSVLKLAGGSVDRVLAHAAEARSDFRDTLSWAEYPRQSRLGVAEWLQLSEAERERIGREDRDEYLAWLGDVAAGAGAGG